MGSDEKDPYRNDHSLQCPVCLQPLSFRIAKGRKSGKPFLMLLCLRDGRHFRGFIGDQKFVEGIIGRLESSHQNAANGASDVNMEKTKESRTRNQRSG